MTFLGSSADEIVRFGSWAQRYPVVARMRGGDDAIWMEHSSAPGSILSTGPGHDAVSVNPSSEYGDVPFHTVSLDLDRHRLDYGRPAQAPDAVLNGVEDVRISGEVVHVVGDEKANRVEASGCRVEVHGGPGADRLYRGGESFGACDPLSRLLGGPGPDRLIGALSISDVLLGGPGHDFANGKTGHRDVCKAEVHRNCDTVR